MSEETFSSSESGSGRSYDMSINSPKSSNQPDQGYRKPSTGRVTERSKSPSGVKTE